MFGAFRNRRPWTAAIISLFVGPWLGMLFLNKGRWALIYLAALGILIVAIVKTLPNQDLPGGKPIVEFFKNSNGVLAIVGAIHAWFLARRWDATQSLPWYSRRWYFIFAIPAGAIVSFLGVRTFVYQPFNIPSGSMFPAAGTGDFLLVSKFAYNFSDPERGDPVIFWAPEFHSYFLKRIVGLPGDRVQMKGGRVVLNGVQLPVRRIENYSGTCDLGYGCAAPQYEETYPGGRVVRVLDENPTGPLDSTEIFNVPQGAYFVLGDSRDNSNDSRESIGFVSRNNIIGKAAFKYINHGHWTWQKVD